jgi:hypothetical protein
MYVQLGIPEYILIWNFGFFCSGYVQCYVCMEISVTFSTESKLHHLIMYSVQNFVMVTIHAVLLLLIALLHPAAVSRTHNMEPILVQLTRRTLL